MANVIKINGIWVPTPGEFDWQISDLDASAERSAAGFLIRERIRENVHKLTFNWPYVERLRFYEFIAQMKDLPPNFDLQFPDATGELLTLNMYRADVTANMFAYQDEKSHWKNCKTSFIEI